MSNSATDPVVERCLADSDIDLDDHDPRETFGWDKADAKDQFLVEIEAVSDLQRRLFAAEQAAVLVVLQAMDAGGKDGTIRSVLTGVNPAGVDVNAFGVPTEEERAHDFLWRVHAHTPQKGTIGVFNRSHYEDVLVVRVKEIVPEPVWKGRYEHIRNFEQLLTDEGTSVIKIFLNISDEEQRERLQDRVDDPDERFALLASTLEDSIATVFRQIAMNRFEHACHTARRTEGELSVERFGELWAESQTDMLDKARAIEDTVMEQSARQRQTIDEMAR